MTSPFYVNGGGVALPAGDAIYLPNVSFDQAADSYNPTTDVITVSNGSADGTVTIDVVGRSPTTIPSCSHSKEAAR